jgi:hypothetical protein
MERLVGSTEGFAQCITLFKTKFITITEAAF